LSSSHADSLPTAIPSAFCLTPSNVIEFVKSPPAVDTLVFKRVIYDKPRAFKSKDEAERYLQDNRRRTNHEEQALTQLFALRYYSPDNFVFHQINDANDAWSSTVRLGTFAGRANGLWWDLTRNGAVTTDSTNGIYQLNQQDNSTFPIIFKFATELLHLGMFDLDPTTLERSQETHPSQDQIHFTARSQYGETVEGTCESQDGLISRITYAIRTGGGDEPHRIIELTYVNHILRSVQVSQLVNGATDPLPYCCYEVLELREPQPGSTPHSACALQQFLLPADKHVLIKRNGDMFAVADALTTQIHPHDLPKTFLKPAITRRIFLVITILILIIPLFLLWFYRHSIARRRNMRT